MYIIPLVGCYHNLTKGQKYLVAKALGNAMYFYDDNDELTVIDMTEMAKSFALYKK